MSETTMKSESAKLLEANWHAFCDCDSMTPPSLSRDAFIEQMEIAGFVRIRAVTKKDIEDDVFAAERGIELGGHIWELTEIGRWALNEATDERMNNILLAHGFRVDNGQSSQPLAGQDDDPANG